MLMIGLKSIKLYWRPIPPRNKVIHMENSYASFSMAMFLNHHQNSLQGHPGVTKNNRPWMSRSIRKFGTWPICNNVWNGVPTTPPYNQNQHKNSIGQPCGYFAKPVWLKGGLERCVFSQYCHLPFWEVKYRESKSKERYDIIGWKKSTSNNTLRLCYHHFLFFYT